MSGPPVPRLTLTVGVTGHREIDPNLMAHVQGEAERALKHLIGRHSGAQHETRLLSQLAAGADQIFASIALAEGARLQALLPFDKSAYLASLPDTARENFNRLSTEAVSIWIAPETGKDEAEAYHLAGQVMLAQSDILIALWDGQPGRGIGGTAYVVAHAVREGIPVIHIHPDGRPTEILWSQFDHMGSQRLDAAGTPRHFCTVTVLNDVVARLLGPPQNPDQAAGLADFLAERERRVRLRLEYPLLLALTGVRALDRTHLVADPYDHATKQEWADYHTALMAIGVDSEAQFGQLQAAFSWCDRLADHYAQVYRSGTILNYVAAAISVMAALDGLLVPQAKPILLVIELLSIAALIGNTVVGNRRQWHRRWLDYRYLAEQLRPMRSLKLVGAFGPRPGAGAQAAASITWPDWYASMIWRQLDLPPQVHNSAEAARLAANIAANELDPQILYHASNASRMNHLDHRLHQAGTVLFVASLVCSSIGLIGYLAHIEAILQFEKLLTALGVALPTLGASLFGIRGQSDFAGAARRSAETTKRLRRTAEQMRAEHMTLSMAARLSEDAAQTMAADLGEWRTAFLERRIAIPS